MISNMEATKQKTFTLESSASTPLLKEATIER